MYQITTTVSKDTLVKLMLSALLNISIIDVFRVQMNDIIMDDDEKDAEHKEKLAIATQFDFEYQKTLMYTDEEFAKFVELNKRMINIDGLI